MSDDIEEQIQRAYQAYQKDPGNPAHSLTIGQLYEKRKEYVNALPWFESAFDSGGRVDAALELHIVTLRTRALADEIEGFRQYLAREDDPEIQETIKAKIDSMLDALNALLKQKKDAERRSREQE